MARRKKEEKEVGSQEEQSDGFDYHCDMYYYDGVCKYRGESDEADLRFRDGWLLQKRAFCRNFGINERHEVCQHCIEYRWMFRKEPQFRGGHAKKADHIIDIGRHEYNPPEQAVVFMSHEGQPYAPRPGTESRKLMKCPVQHPCLDRRNGWCFGDTCNHGVFENK